MLKTRIFQKIDSIFLFFLKLFFEISNFCKFNISTNDIISVRAAKVTTVLKLGIGVSFFTVWSCSQSGNHRWKRYSQIWLHTKYVLYFLAISLNHVEESDGFFPNFSKVSQFKFSKIISL
jgi:hypothetical protein